MFFFFTSYTSCSFFLLLHFFIFLLPNAFCFRYFSHSRSFSVLYKKDKVRIGSIQERNQNKPNKYHFRCWQTHTGLFMFVSLEQKRKPDWEAVSFFQWKMNWIVCLCVHFALTTIVHLSCCSFWFALVRFRFHFHSVLWTRNEKKKTTNERFSSHSYWICNLVLLCLFLIMTSNKRL